MSQLLRKYLPSLKLFKEINGNLLVPRKFVVPQSIGNKPSSAWPSQFHDIKLGSIVQTIRKNIKDNKLSNTDLAELAEINFIPDAKQYYSNLILLAFREYKRITGDCNLQRKYVVPNTVDWPQALHGLKLGVIQTTMRSDEHSHKSIRDAITELGFNLVATENNGADFPRTYSGFVAYKSIHGDLNILFDFVVPHGDVRYPENTWGMKLGHTMANIRCKGVWSEHRAQLEALGVNYEVKPVRREPFEVIYSALESYKAIHDDVHIVYDFVVPFGDARYPESTWGMKLGYLVNNIRHRGDYGEHREQLMALGLRRKRKKKAQN